jgi:thioredoxin 1
MSEYPLRGRIRTVTASTFNSLVLESEGPIVVEFMSYGCSHCRTIAPILEQVAKTLETKERIFMVNIAVDPELAERYEIQGTPTFIMFLNGQGIGMVEGLRPDFPNVLAAVTEPYEQSRKGWAHATRESE